MNPVERGIRRAGNVVIALFIFLFFVPYVGSMLYDAIRRNPRALLEFLQLPGCWMVLLGPVLFWTSLASFYFRLPREIRQQHVGVLRSHFDLGALAFLFHEYRKLHGFDWLLWIMVLSGVLTLVVVAAAIAAANSP